MRLSVALLLLLSVAFSCRQRQPRGGTAVDDGANIDQALSCGNAPPVGPGNSNELQRYVLDPAVFPDALCNDGSPAVLYYRPFNGPANTNKWVFNLHGGGSCNSGPACLARWCNCSNARECPYVEAPTNFTRSTMSNDGPTTKKGDGVFLRGDATRPNPFGDYNQVELQYCTSDLWSGTRRSVELSGVNPKTNEPVTYTVHFLGARVLDADVSVLRRNGVPGLVYSLNGGAQEMPDLDDAVEVVFTGDSAGGAGVITNLDYLTDLLRASNTGCNGATCPLKVYGLLDAIVGPDKSKLDFSAIVDPSLRSYDAAMANAVLSPNRLGARRDASCESWHDAHEPATKDRCTDEMHVIRHHISTPFFVRMALLDTLISANYVESGLRNADGTVMTVSSFAQTLQAELNEFDVLSAAAEESSAITKQPGVFAPACAKHDTIHDNLETWGTTITTSTGATVRLLEVFENWKNGLTPSNVLTESATLADTHCP